MAVSLALLPVVMFSSLIIGFSHSTTPSITQIGAETSCGRGHLKCELEEAKLKMARLESILEETIQDLNAKSLNLTDSQKLIEEMAKEIDHLRFKFSSLKGESSHAHKRLYQLEEEVRLLWAALRKSNFEIHLLESKARDADDRIELVTARVETTAAIVTEQWIQIQQLEQALHIAEVKGDASFTKCTFLKVIRSFLGNSPQKLMGMLDSYLYDEEPSKGSYWSQALHYLEKILSAVKKYHHKLQGFIKQEMERNEFTAPLAHKELVFFVASALITFPLMAIWILLSSQFS